jgi:hypothetical protein
MITISTLKSIPPQNPLQLELAVIHRAEHDRNLSAILSALERVRKLKLWRSYSQEPSFKVWAAKNQWSGKRVVMELGDQARWEK